MLQIIREYTQGWIAKAIVSIIILTFALWGIHSYFTTGNSNTNIANVNGIDITKDQLVVAYERLKRQAQIQLAPNTSLSVKDESLLKSRALQALIEVEVLKQASQTQNYLVADRQVNNYLYSMPEFQINGQFDVTRFNEVLSSALLSTSEFVDLVRTSLLIDQPKLGFVFTSFALPDETLAMLELVNQERAIEYVIIPLEYFLSRPLAISPQKVQAYYEAHKREFMTPEQVNIEYLQLSLQELAKSIHPTEAILQAFYNENINSYTEPTQWQFEVITLPLALNASDEEIRTQQRKAVKLAHDMRAFTDLSTIAKQVGGKLETYGWTSLAHVPQDLQKVVSALARAGDVAQPTRTSHGFSVVKVLAKKPPITQPFAVVKAKIQAAYIRQHAEEKFSELREKLSDFTYEHPDSLAFAANALNLPIRVSELFIKNKSGNDISQYKKVRDIAFSNDVLNLQNNSEVIQLNPDSVVVLRVKSHIQSSLLPLSQISKQIEEKLKIKEAEVRNKNFVANLLAKLQAGDNSTKLLAQYKFAWKQPGLVKRYSAQLDSAILDLSFRLAVGPSKYSYGMVRLPNGYALVHLLRIQPGASMDKQQQLVFAEQIQNSLGLLEYELYKRSQMQAAKIKIIPVK